MSDLTRTTEKQVTVPSTSIQQVSEEQEKKVEEGRESARRLAALLLMTAVTILRWGIFLLGVFFLLGVCGSGWAFWRGDTLFISAMGLIWVLLCLFGYLMLQEFAGVSENLDPLFQSFAEFGGKWESQWEKWFGLRKLMTDERLRGFGEFLAFAEGAGEEVKQ